MSIQNTLPDPANLRRWGKQANAKCPLCGWKYCDFRHVLCWCKVGLDQGRISWRHDSVLMIIAKWLKKSLAENRKQPPQPKQSNKVLFVKQGMKLRMKLKKQHFSYWENFEDWQILVDTRQKQYHVPPQIAATAQRPDICIYSLNAKKVCFVELTSPQEEYMTYWRQHKQIKYQELVDQAKANGFTAMCRTVEVGARGFVAKQSMSLFSMMGCNHKTYDKGITISPDMRCQNRTAM